MACIIVATGPQHGLFLPIGKKTVVIGRDEGLLLQLEDELVSRKHLRIRYDPDADRYFALDLGSRNGTTHNRHLLTKETELLDGDELVLGESRIVFTYEIPQDQTNALEVLKKFGQRFRSTMIEK